MLRTPWATSALATCLVALVGCAAGSGPKPPRPPPTSVTTRLPRLWVPDPGTPLYVQRGEHWLRAIFGLRAPLSGPTLYLDRLEIDGVTVYPRACPGGPLCTDAHLALAEAHGSQALLARVRETDDRVDLVLAGAFFGSPECGVYGYYVVRIDPGAATVGPPAQGCFSSPDDGGLVVEAGPPLRLRPASTGLDVVELELDEANLGWFDRRTPRTLDEP